MSDGEILDRASERRALGAIGIASAAVLAFLFWLLYVHDSSGAAPAWVASLPSVNAFLNFASAVFLVAAVAAIRSGRPLVHMRLVLTALAFSALFLASYVVYHHFQGDTPFRGEGWIRPAYFFILVSHILLSIATVPLVLATVYFAATRRFRRHRRLARIAFPVWLYVSTTGVAVYFLLQRYGSPG